VANPQTPVPQHPGQQQQSTGAVYGAPPPPAAGTANVATPAVRPSRPHGALLVITLVVAVVALVVALAAVVLSAVAIGRSDEAAETVKKSQVLPTTAADMPSPPAETATAEDSPEPTDAGVTPTPTDISPTAQFTVEYEGQHLRVRSVACRYGGSPTYVDLDEPRVGGTEETNMEFGYAGCDPGAFHTSLPFAQVSGPAATPKDCLETIRTDPGRAPIAPTRGTTLCIVSDQNQAAAQGISQKLAFVTVDSVSVDGGAGVLNITVKSWAVPR
jgi:hypothetical protein